MSAEKKLMDYLARRPHSEKELREKLGKDFSPEDIESALDRARGKGWLQPPSELSAVVVEQLNRRGKGSLYIQAYLEEKGLPPVQFERESEIQKAHAVILRKLHLEPPFVTSAHEAILTLLQSRGFDDEVAQRSILETRARLA